MYVKEIDLDELIESLDEGGMKDKLLKTADLLQKLIKPGDPDRHDFAAVRDHIESNNMKTVKQIVMNMDTEPRERVVVAMAKGLGRAETEKILSVKLNMGEEVDLDEKVQFEAPTKDGNTFQIIDRDTKGMRGTQDKFKMQIVDKRGKVIKDLGSHPSLNGAKGMAKNRGIIEEVELDEAKYDLYHKDFSTAMQHAYKMAKKMYGITVDPEEIDDKVASGPRKPSEGKTNKYRLKGDKGAIQIQVYNKGGSKPFELNMYKEEVELDEAMLIGRDYEYDEKEGVVKISKKNFAKVRKDAKGTDKSKPTMMVLTKKGTSLVPVKFTEEVELDERSAAAQARRDARGEFDDKPEKGDDVATDADKKRGDENIINQLRKALDNPKHEVRFADGKSEVVKPDIVKAALKIFMQLKSNDKRKLQPIYAKSAKSLTSIVSRMMRKMHYEGVEEMNEDFRTGRFGVSHSLVDAVKDVIMGKRVNETNKNDKSDDGEGLDAVQPKAVKKKFKDRKDKDIDNDGDVDDSDKFLHKRRKAVSKAVDKEESKKIKEQDDEDEKETAKKAKKDEPKKNGKEKVEVDPTLDEVKEEMTEAQKAKREEIVKELKKKSADFKEKYGDRWEDVMYATATKMAMKAA